MGATRAYEANVAAVGAVKGMAMKALDSEGRRAAGSITGKWS